MHKIIALMAFAALPLFAGFFPSTVHTSISSAAGDNATLKSPLPVNGMSGIVIHDYGNELKAITTYVTQTASDGSAKLIAKDIMDHESLPMINTAVKAGDQVIAGYLYNNILLLAPDAHTYAKITSSHNKKWVHPDLFALFISQEGDAYPTRENLAAFAKDYQVGLVYIVRQNSAVLLDPISGQIVGEKAMSDLPAQGEYPFHMRFEKIDAGWFADDDKVSYYQVMESI